MLSRTQSEFQRLVGRPDELKAISDAIAARSAPTPPPEGTDPPSDASPTLRSSAQSLGPSKKVVPSGKAKLCTKCKLHKPLERFPPHKDTRDGLAAHCKDCRAVLRKKRNETNFEAKLKHHFAARMTLQLAEMDELPPLVANMEQYVGYTMADLIIWLNADIFEREEITLKEAFKRGYHVDHIRPLSLFPVKHIDDPEFKKCWAMTNLRMMSAEDNLKKGAKDIYEDD